MLADEGKLIIADGFAKERISEYEAEFRSKFSIEDKIDITYNVRNARYLSVERHNRIAAHGLNNTDYFQKLSNLFYTLLPEEQTPLQGVNEPDYASLKQKSMLYKELDLSQRQYFIYVLKPLKTE